MFRILVVEDSDEEAAELIAAIDAYAANSPEPFSVVREPSAFSLVEQASSFDLVLLDIDLPGINGMDAAQELREHGVRTLLVFVTNLAQYAVHGYAVDALDFLVKPVTRASVAMVLDKALRIHARTAQSQITVATKDELVVIPLTDLVYVEVRNHDLDYHLAGQKLPVRGHGSLVTVERQLDGISGASFVRIHASCLVNMARIRRVRRDSVVLDDGAELRFSRAKRASALERIAEYFGGTS